MMTTTALLKISFSYLKPSAERPPSFSPFAGSFSTRFSNTHTRTQGSGSLVPPNGGKRPRTVACEQNQNLPLQHAPRGAD